MLRVVDVLDPARLVPRRIAARTTWFAVAGSVLLFGGVLLWEIEQARDPLHRFDWMLVTGYATVLVGLWAARGQSARFADAARRLSDREALIAIGKSGETTEVGRDEVEELLDDVARRARVRSHRWGVAAAVATAVVFYIVYDRMVAPEPWFTLLATGLATAIGYLVGRALGRLATFGFVRSPLLARNRSIRADPGHIDGAAGLKPLGDFYLTQALLLLIPGVFLLAWTLLLRDRYWSDFYGQWEGIYQALLGVVVLLQALIFVAPMLTTHEAMKRQKRRELQIVDGRCAEIRQLRGRLEKKLSRDEREAVEEQLQAVTDRYREVDAMPTWPVPRAIWRGFALQSVALAAPIVTDAVKSFFGL